MPRLVVPFSLLVLVYKFRICSQLMHNASARHVAAKNRSFNFMELYTGTYLPEYLGIEIMQVSLVLSLVFIKSAKKYYLNGSILLIAVV